jgi:hypothetical protein
MGNGFSVDVGQSRGDRKDAILRAAFLAVAPQIDGRFEREVGNVAGEKLQNQSHFIFGGSTTAAKIDRYINDILSDRDETERFLRLYINILNESREKSRTITG